MNKKGAEFTISTLIVIVLAIIILVVLALGFGTGWTNLWSKMTGFFSPVNVDAVKQACQVACASQSSYAYCCQIRDVKFASNTDAEKITCSDTRLKGDCSLDCNIKTVCANLVCGGDTADKGNCEPNNQENLNKKFGKNGEIIGKGKVCCEPKGEDATP